MRDKRFVAAHRGGPLSKDHHRQLISWAAACAGHVLQLIELPADKRLTEVLQVAAEWAKDKASVGEARNASFVAIAVANEWEHPVAIAVARAVGHAVATAHMADHALRAAAYALKAVQLSGQATAAERAWQDKQLTPGIAALVLSARQDSK